MTDPAAEPQTAAGLHPHQCVTCGRFFDALAAQPAAPSVAPDLRWDGNLNEHGRMECVSCNSSVLPENWTNHIVGEQHKRKARRRMGEPPSVAPDHASLPEWKHRLAHEPMGAHYPHTHEPPALAGLDEDTVFTILGSMMPRTEPGPWWLTRDAFRQHRTRLAAQEPQP